MANGWLVVGALVVILAAWQRRRERRLAIDATEADELAGALAWHCGTIRGMLLDGKDLPQWGYLDREDSIEYFLQKLRRDEELLDRLRRTYNLPRYGPLVVGSATSRAMSSADGDHLQHLERWRVSGFRVVG